MKRILRMLHEECPYEVLVKLNVLFKMKIIIITLVVAASLQVNANGYAQKTVTLAERNSTLLKVFKQIKKQTGYSYVITNDLLAQAGKVNIEVANVTLREALDMIFREQPLAYEIIGMTIVVKEREEPKKVAIVSGAPIDVRGRVVNEKGEPVEGVTVSVKGTKKFTITNANGEFSLATVDPEAVLVFTSVNMETFEYEVSGKSEFVVSLKTKITSLGDVTVISTGYQSLKPNEVTGSVTTITKQQLDQRVAPDIISKLEGITNGLVFNKAPNGENRLRIRGESTIFGYAEPLIVVDNFPYDGDISNINPNDVESVTILKDAAAASIWGVQAGNGVIVITTKRGKLNQPIRLQLTSNVTVSDKPDLFYSPLLSPSSYIDFETFLYSKGYYAAALANLNLLPVSPVVEILNNRKLGLISASDSASQIAALRKNDWRNEQLKYVYQKPVYQQYQLNISGGGNKMSYYMSGGYDKSISNLIGNSSNRITLNAGNTFIPITGLELNANISYSESNTQNDAISTIPNLYPYMLLKDAHGLDLPIPQHRAVFEDTIAKRSFLDWKYYPLKERDYKDNSTKNFTTRIFASLRYKLLPGLNADISYQYLQSSAKGKSLNSQQSYYIRNNINKFAIVDNNGNYLSSNYPLGGELNTNTSNVISTSGRIGLNYSHNWQRHRVSALAGFDLREIKAERNGYTYYGYSEENGTFTSPDLYTQFPTVYPTGASYLTGSKGGNGLSYSSTTNRFRSYFADASYIYNERYVAFGSIRFDGSNYFGVNTNNKTVPLWSAGLKWNIDREKFYHLKTLSALSFKVSYGFNGNMATNVAALTTIRYSLTPAASTNLPYASINNVPNPELRWEKVSHFNAGFDFVLKNGIVTGSIEYFHKNGDDLIGDAPLDPTTGVTQLRGNFSGMKSEGVDIQLNTKNISGKFNWNTAFLFNYASEIVTRYDISLPAISYLNIYGGDLVTVQVGKPLYRLMSYRWAGLDPNNGNPIIYLSDTLNKSYTPTITNLIKESDLKYSGRYNPSITGSILNSFSWKGLSFRANIIYKLNYYFRRSSVRYSTMIAGWQSAHEDYELRWQKPGDELKTNVPSFIYPLPANNNTRENFYLLSDALVEKGDHIRLQFINLSYSLQARTLTRLRIQGLDFNLYINNIGILWRANDKHIDPDYPYASYPSPRTYSFGMRATF